MTGWEAVHIDDLDAIPVAQGLEWRPVRRRLGIHAFGINAYTSEAVGDQIVEEHDELTDRRRGRPRGDLHRPPWAGDVHIDGEALDAPAGTLVFIREPALKRVAIAEEEGTFVLAVGGEPGRAYEVSPWEFSFSAAPLLKAGRFDEALALLNEGLAEHPRNASLLYNLACAEAQTNHPLEALTHLSEALLLNPGYSENARSDPDFDPIRAEPGFPA